MRNDFIVFLVMAFAVFHHVWNASIGRFVLIHILASEILVPVMSRFGFVDPNPVNARFGELLITSPHTLYLKPTSYGFALIWMVVCALTAAKAVTAW